MNSIFDNLGRMFNNNQSSAGGSWLSNWAMWYKNMWISIMLFSIIFVLEVVFNLI